MPSGDDIERAFRPVLKGVGMSLIKSWAKTTRKEYDPFTAPYTLASKFIPTIEAMIDEAGKSLLVSLGQADADTWLVRNPEILNNAKTAAFDLCNDTIDTFVQDTLKTIDAMRAELSASIASGETGGDLVDRLSRYVDSESRWRARRIAVTESARAYNAGTMGAAGPLDYITGFKWLISDDACPLCHTIARQCPVIRKGGTFAINGTNKTYRDVKGPPAHPGCRCSILEVFEDEMPAALKPPLVPDDGNYIRPEAADYEAAEAGGYLSVAIGNATDKSFQKTGFILED